MMKSIIIGMMIYERRIYVVLCTGIATAVAMRNEEDWRKKGLSVVSGEKTSTLNSLSLPSGAFRASLLPSGWDSAPHQSKQRKNANLNALIMMAVKSVQR
jgi:hypothetical protein